MRGKQPTCHPLEDKKEWYLHHSPDDSGYEKESKHLRVNNLNASTELKGGRIVWLDGTVPYLNKVHIVHSVEVISRKNQDILNILTSWILQHRSIFYITTFNIQLAFRFFLAFFMMRKEIAKGK